MRYARGLVYLSAALTFPLIPTHARADTLLEQDFSDGGAVAGYVSASPNAGQFHYIGSANNATAAIADEALVFTLPALNDSAGFFRGGLGDGGVMAFSGDFIVHATDPTGFGPAGHLTFGDYSDSTTHTSHNHLNALFAEIGFRWTGGTFRMESGGGAATAWNHTLNYNTRYRLTFLLNDSEIAQSYVGPDGETHDLSVSLQTDANSDEYVRGSYAIWITDLDAVGGPQHLLVADDAPASTYVHSGIHHSSRVLDSILFDVGGREVNRAWEWDNIVVNDGLPIPEPASLALVGVGAAAMRGRRRS